MVSMFASLDHTFEGCWSVRIKAKPHVNKEFNLLWILFETNLVAPLLTDSGLYVLKGEARSHISGVHLSVHLRLERAC